MAIWFSDSSRDSERSMNQALHQALYRPHKIFEINQDWASLFKSTIAWMESIVTLQSSRPVVHGSSESSWIFTIIHSPKIWWIAMELGILGEFWEHFPNLSEPQAVQPIARQIMEGVQQLHDFGIVLAYGIHQLCWMKISCCGILVEKLEKWRSG